MSNSSSEKKKNALITSALVVLIIAIFALSFALAPKPSDENEEGFAGTDSVVVETIEDEGYQPWFNPIFEPGSGEIESGLFAMQAAIGAAIVGFAFGNLRGRKKAKDEIEAANASSATTAS